MARSSFFKDGGSGSNTATAIQNQLDIAAASAASAATSLASIDTQLADATAARIAAQTARDAALLAKTDAETARDVSITNSTSAGSSASSASTSENNASSSAANASTSAFNAAASETAAASSETNAAASQSAAATSASNAATSETNAATSASNAATSATASQTAQTASETAKTAAETAKTAAETAETNAAASQSAAATSASNAATSETNAATSASNAATSATGASSSASSAASAQTAAEAARDSALAAFDSFDDRYLGSKATGGGVGDPTVDNDGNSLVSGALFYDETNNVVKVYTGSAWVAAYVSGGSFAQLSGATFTGDVTVPNLITAGNVDGRDVSADGTKLDGISTGADVTPSWVPSSDPGYITSADGGNAATLDSIDSSQFLRSDAEDSGTILNLDGGTAHGANDATLHVTAGDNSDWGIKISAETGKTDYGQTIRMPSSFNYAFHVTKGGSEHVAIDATGIKISAAHYVWHAGNDGSGSGLDADLLDGLHSTSFHQTTATDFAYGMTVGNSNSALSSTGTFNLYRAGNPFIAWYSNSTSRGAYQQYIGTGDRMYFGDVATLESAGNVIAYASDERLKTDFAKVENALEKVCALEGVTYRWDEEKCVSVGFRTKFDQTEIGLRAQQVQEQFPQIVTAAPFDKDEEGNSKSGENYLTLNYERLVPVLIEAIKELKAEVEELKNGSPQ